MDATRPTRPASPLLAAPRLLAASGFIAAGLLAWSSWNVNLERACAVRDTPDLDVCAPTADADTGRSLRARIADNPGDANAYVQLALAERSPQAVAAAARVAPQQPSVLLLQAKEALDREDWARAVPPLVSLVEHRGTPAAADILARLIAGGQGALLAPHLQPGTQWLQRVLARMPQSQATFSTALPLIVRALQARILEPEAIRFYIRQLKTAGAWADAYSLWLALQGHSLPILFNGGFDQPFQPDGFDWETGAGGPVSRAGAIVERRGAEERGAVLDIRFTGRAITLPMARQSLFLGSGRWRVRGEYMSRLLRAERGLVWTLRCASRAEPYGRSEALDDTGGAWRAFAFDVAVPPGCGAVSTLQLETWSPSDAVLGARGRVAFDALSLEKLAP